MTLLVMSCSEDGVKTGHGVDYQYGRNLSHEKIVLGSRLENPYKTENITKALQELYPTKADRVEVKTTDLYVRFLPKSDSEYEILKGMEVSVRHFCYHMPSVDSHSADRFGYPFGVA